MAASRKREPAKKGAASAATAACGCGPVSGLFREVGTHAGEPAAVLDGVGPGAHAAGVDNAIKAANLKHLRRIEGQVRGLAGMVEEDRYCADIIAQVSAVRESLQTVARNLMRNHLQHCAANAMHDQGMTREAMVDELMELVVKLRR